MSKICIRILKNAFSDVSQPSLGTEVDHPERTTPPLSPMYYSDGQSIQVSVSSRGGKAQVLYAKPSSTTSMETHWEEAILACRPEKKWDKPKQIKPDGSIDNDDTESELIAIPESDLSDSTLHGSVQDSFEEGSESCCNKDKALVKTQDLETSSIKSPRESYVSCIVVNKQRPTWIIGSEDESLRSCDNKKSPEYCSKNSTSSVNLNRVYNYNHIANDAQKNTAPINNDTSLVGKVTPMGKHKKVIEPSITPVCTPVSDCDDCYKNNQTLLPTPSLERLLPIGATRIPG